MFKQIALIGGKWVIGLGLARIGRGGKQGKQCAGSNDDFHGNTPLPHINIGSNNHSMNTMSYHHASCVCINGKGVLILGESGAGKSDLALRLIHSGAVLVADDQVKLAEKNGQLLASCHERIQGRIEARGVGILTVPHVQDVPLSLAIQLVERDHVQRLPDAAFFDCFGVQVPLLSLHAFDMSVSAKIFLYLTSLQA